MKCTDILLLGFKLLHLLLLTVQPQPDEVGLDALMLTFADIEKPLLIVHAGLGPDLVIELVLRLLLKIPLTIYGKQKCLKIECQNLLSLLKFKQLIGICNNL